MTDAGRKRIDVSGEVHGLLEAEARRRGVPIRDLVDRAVTEMLDRRVQADLSIRQQRASRHATHVEEQTAQLGELARRFAALLERQARDVPRALTDGFDAIKTTIRETGGTGHLRDMIVAFEKTFIAKVDHAHATQVALIAALTDAVGNRGDRIEARIADLKNAQAGRGKVFGAGVLLGLMLLVLVGLLLPDTAPSRWLAVRLAGATRPIDAAWTLAGDGRAGGLLMAETHGLLHNREFRVSYGRCADRAKRATAPFTCRVTVPPLLSVDR